MPTKITAPASQKTKVTPAERRKATQDAERQAREQALAQFEANRASVWAAIWAAATRLKLCLNDEPKAAEDNSWWFEAFSVNARNQTFTCMGSDVKEVSQASLTFDMSAQLMRELVSGQDLFERFVKARERRRSEAETLAQRKNDALGRIPQLDRQLLGLPSAFYPQYDPLDE